MILIDVHAHMDLDGYEQYGGADKVIDECIANDVKIIICNGVDSKSNRKVLEICNKHDICKAALGIYPTHCLEYIEQSRQAEFEDELRFIEQSISSHHAKAIGEVGLEYKEIKNITESQKQIQKQCLSRFLDIAKKYDVPVILHSRGAELELIEFLEQNGMKQKKVIMHCFSGRKHHIKRIIENGWTFSIPCTILRTEHFQNIVQQTSLSQLFTETDSPYLSPHIGKINRPDNVLLTINKIAQLKGMLPQEVANVIYNNYQRMFN